MGRKCIDETGHIYGKWTVLRKAEQRNSCNEVCWVCRCECGNEKIVSGKILRRGNSTSCGECNKINIGDVFHNLIVINEAPAKNGHSYWKCKCTCGKIIDVRGSNLKSGNTKSCGCSKNSRLNLLNQKFGLLTVIEDAGNDPKGNSLWKCKCDCGNVKIIRGSNLINHNTLTCGCRKMSFGEIQIKNILDENDIIYQQEYIVPELNNKRFDFAIFNKDNKLIRLIEFDGIQHYEENEFFKGSLDKRQKADKQKDEWALKNHIPLKRIPYWELGNITLAMLLK